MQKLIYRTFCTKYLIFENILIFYYLFLWKLYNGNIVLSDIVLPCQSTIII
jgi:hypothetical protein